MAATDVASSAPGKKINKFLATVLTLPLLPLQAAQHSVTRLAHTSLSVECASECEDDTLFLCSRLSPYVRPELAIESYGARAPSNKQQSEEFPHARDVLFIVCT